MQWGMLKWRKASGRNESVSELSRCSVVPQSRRSGRIWGDWSLIPGGLPAHQNGFGPWNLTSTAVPILPALTHICDDWLISALQKENINSVSVTILA